MVNPETTDALPRVESLPRWLRGELRSDHAGETGAVWIYRGILQFSRDPVIRNFAKAHLVTEEDHLRLFDEWLASSDKSYLLPAWRLAGWLLGATSVAGGRRGVFITIEAVETFVVSHYRQQLEQLGDDAWASSIAEVLERCMQDEAHHRDDAASRYTDEASVAGAIWRRVVGSGSAAAVSVARAF